ncbi:hypothetical protein GOV07_05740 [Candidatus Woesearchaeota archaeon]|nr:hypothetical protein [Candidatus Woesearchaeota archaeon]
MTMLARDTLEKLWEEGELQRYYSLDALHTGLDIAIRRGPVWMLKPRSQAYLRARWIHKRPLPHGTPIVTSQVKSNYDYSINLLAKGEQTCLSIITPSLLMIHSDDLPELYFSKPDEYIIDLFDKLQEAACPTATAVR